MASNARLRERLQDKLPEILLEAGSVLFAILLAFAVEEWREERQEARFAERARAAVQAEVRSNLEELRQSLDAQAMTIESVQEASASIDSVGGIHVDFIMPELSSAAWRAAQTSQAVTSLDYAWLLGVARAYEVQELYLSGQQGLLESLVPSGDSPQQWLQAFVTRLNVNHQLGRQLAESYTRLLEEPRAP